ncbi:MAG: hypothetical protein ACP5UN_02560 [Candidatus Micrarchaeia archaeon]
MGYFLSTTNSCRESESDIMNMAILKNKRQIVQFALESLKIRILFLKNIKRHMSYMK